MADAEYGLVESFNIDDGQLDGQTPQNCFVLGYELASIARRAEFVEEEFHCPVQALNRERIEAALTKRGRKFTLTWAGDDRSEEWMHLVVGPRD